MSRKKTNFFWASYADLMTSMFFIMLVLFVLTVVILKREQKRILLTLEEFRKIEEVKRSINEISKAYFEYRPEYKKHILKLRVQFPTGRFRLSDLSDTALLDEIEKAGQEIENIIKSFTYEDNIQYLVIIEGQASMDGYYIDDFHNNNVLSYQRAFNLAGFWESRGIFLDQLPNCELVIAGSGEKGVPREKPDLYNPMNQRFLIHIIPKTGEIEVNDIL